MKLEKTNIAIRLAVPEESAAITALIYESFVDHRSRYTEKSFAATTPGQKEIEDRIDKKTVWVAVENKNILGTVSIVPCREGSFIRSMAVKPLARGKGIGKALMMHIQEVAITNGSGCLTLNTTPFLTAAIGLYEEFGFKRRGLNDLYGTTLISMIKNISPATKIKMGKNDYAK